MTTLVISGHFNAEILHITSLEGNFGIFQPGLFFTTFLCLSDQICNWSSID